MRTCCSMALRTSGSHCGGKKSVCALHSVLMTRDARLEALFPKVGYDLRMLCHHQLVGASEEVLDGLIHAWASRALVGPCNMDPHMHDREPVMHNFTRLHHFGLG